MKLVFSGNRSLQRDALYRLIFRGLRGGYSPILLMGDRSFDFYAFLRARKKARIPISLLDTMQFASVVNGHHVRPLIRKSSEFDTQKTFTIFLDFTRHYLDDTVPEEVRRYMFRRDLEEIGVLEETSRPVFFFEGGTPYPATIQQELRALLFQASRIHLEASERRFIPRKFFLRPSEEKQFFGEDSSCTTYLCEKLAEKWKPHYKMA